MPQVVETTVYTFAELSEESKERARAWYRNGMWEDGLETERISELFTEVLSALGFDFKTYWSLGYSQSDYVALDGTFTSSELDGFLSMKSRGVFDNGTWLDAYKPSVTWADFPTLSEYRDDLDFIVRLSEGGYYHRSSFDIESNDLRALDGFDYEADPAGYDALESKLTEEHESLAQTLKDYFYTVCYELQKLGYAEIEYQESNEAVDGSIEANEYRFTEDGSVF